MSYPSRYYAWSKTRGRHLTMDTQLGAENDNERKMGSGSLPCNNPPQNSSKKFGTKKEAGFTNLQYL
ncbi:hypothetical protein QN277_014975 [Acacia crassicarpa]|uniref:Uncharacterized protein n=1 Tax=Acacia crassicarpa TaxID=499986 RepID=A0AAE1JWF6_9FABA|nr:hypothetical protein QN277_014975 [Acacia crassicarpa]